MLDFELNIAASVLRAIVNALTEPSKNTLNWAYFKLIFWWLLLKHFLRSESERSQRQVTRSEARYMAALCPCSRFEHAMLPCLLFIGLSARSSLRRMNIACCTPTNCGPLLLLHDTFELEKDEFAKGLMTMSWSPPRALRRLQFYLR